MTLAPERTDAARRQPALAATVTAVVLPSSGSAPAEAVGHALQATLDGLAEQRLRPDRVVVVAAPEAAGEVQTIATTHRLAADLPVLVAHAPAGAPPAHAVAAALACADDAEVLDPAAVEEHLWLLAVDSDPDSSTLHLLLRTLRGSQSAGVAGPKLVRWEDTSRLHAVGIQATRTGRLLPSPPAGEPDQGQYDDRTDVLGVPLTGMLLSRHLHDDLGGLDPTLEPTAAALDLSWRAHLAGQRVVVVPRAVLATADQTLTTPVGQRRGTARARRQARRVALTRCTIALAPLLALWVLLSSAVASLVLVLAKRPRRAWTELADAGAIVNPVRTVAARIRFRRRAGQVRRRHLRGLFVSSRTSVRASLDLAQDVVLPGTAGESLGATLEAPGTAEPGPVDDASEDLNTMAPSLVGRAVRNPGVLATVVAAVAAGLGTRTWGGNLLQTLGSGVTGGELTTGRAGSSDLWHAWLDGWHGPALGTDAVAGPHLPLLAGLAWLIEHIPFVDAPASSAGTATALVLVLAIPVATASAYVGGRVVTHQRWPRALAALAWSGAATATTTVAEGRVGAAAVLVLLPLVAAGLVRSAQTRGTATAAFAGALLGTLAVAFMPLLLPVLLACGLLQVAFGTRGTRRRGLPPLLVPLALLGPWLGDVLTDPRLLLAGPGLTQWGTVTALPWETALLHPGGAGSYPVLFTAPLVLAAVLGLVRRGADRARWALAVLAVAGIAAAVLAPSVVLGTAPEGSDGGGSVVTPWSGAPLLVAALAVTALALMAVSDRSLRRSEAGWAGPLRGVLALGVGATVLGSSAAFAWAGLGTSLTSWTDPRSAVAVDQAEGPLAGRMLVLTPVDGRVRVALTGRESGDVARSAPSTQALDPMLAAPVSALVAPDAGSTDLPAAEQLAALGVGFVGLDSDAADPLVATLDATAGLARTGSREGLPVWRVRTDVAGVAGPPRVRIQTEVDGANPAPGAGQLAVPVGGAHSATEARVAPASGARLVVGETGGWAEAAHVRADGRLLTAVDDTTLPTYLLPAGVTEVHITVPPAHPLWSRVQGGLALAAFFLALPLGRRRSREVPA